MAYDAKNSPVDGRQLEVQQMVIPIAFTGSASPSSVSLLSDEPSMVFFRSTSVDQITDALRVDEVADFSAAASDEFGIVQCLVRIGEDLEKVQKVSLVNRHGSNVGFAAYLGSDTGITTGDGGGQDIMVLLNVAPEGGGSSVELGTARSYGILGASAVTNTGNTVVTGNLGLYPGTSVTGFPPGVVSGTQDVANAAAQTAQTAAQAAYTSLSALSGSATAINAILDGQTLNPGVYKESSGTFNLATSSAGTLTLDGAGDYIFIASSTLTTGAGGIPTITLSNGATAARVYWIVGSSATINAGSAGTFPGVIIAQASVTDTLGGIVNGSLMALTGAVTLSAATEINAQSLSGGGGLPSADCCLEVNYIVAE